MSKIECKQVASLKDKYEVGDVIFYLSKTKKIKQLLIKKMTVETTLSHMRNEIFIEKKYFFYQGDWVEFEKEFMFDTLDGLLDYMKNNVAKIG